MNQPNQSISLLIVQVVSICQNVKKNEQLTNINIKVTSNQCEGKKKLKSSFIYLENPVVECNKIQLTPKM